MLFTETPLRGAFVIEVEPKTDPRGLFARTVSDDEFAAHGLSARFVQQSLSWNPLIGTLRGLHFQAPPYEEDKLVRVTRGAVYDVIVDLREGSVTRGKWFGVNLTADNRRGLYLPKGFAHGFQTTAAETEVSYQMTVPFHAGASCGIRWNDPALSIEWPLTVDENDQCRLSLPDRSWGSLAQASSASRSQKARQ